MGMSTSGQLGDCGSSIVDRRAEFPRQTAVERTENTSIDIDKASNEGGVGFGEAVAQPILAKAAGSGLRKARGRWTLPLSCEMQQ
jgi:hypothetical protein